MKIAIIGSRGIPNNYGGFEQFAEYLSISLVNQGHEVWVCNAHYHSYTADNLKGVNIRHVYNPETIIGTSGNFIYDFLCLRFAVNLKPDVILMLGYTTSSVWFRFFNFNPSVLVTNLDGLEWKRDKWGLVLKKVTRWFEKLAVKYGGTLVADHTSIQDYFMQQYGVNTTYIPYGADIFDTPNEQELMQFQLKKGEFCLLIARFEAEHNIEMIITGFLQSGRNETLVLIGNYTTPYGEKLTAKYSKSDRIRFLGGIYKINTLNNLRYFSSYYFHGHSIGGTNPSLLEAMAASALIIAHKNPFNEVILGKDALYFNSSGDIVSILKELNPEDPINKTRLLNNSNKIKTHYNWARITAAYENLFKDILNKRKD